MPLGPRDIPPDSSGGLDLDQEPGLDTATELHAQTPAFLQEPTVGRFALAVVEGPRTGETWQSVNDRCVIGSNLLNDLVIEESTVSRYHCEIVIDAEGARIVDLRSRNGTVVDGMRVIEGYLRSGSLIRL